LNIILFRKSLFPPNVTSFVHLNPDTFQTSAFNF